MTSPKLPPLPVSVRNTPSSLTDKVKVQQKIEPPLIEKWTPLLDVKDMKEARDYGFSFGSKKVAMAPGFLNLRFMCHCLARALKMHLDFNPTNA